MEKILTRACSLFAVCLGLFTALPAQAASLQLVPNWGASGVPTNLSMYVYVPDNVAPNPPILVLLHYWGGGAAGVFAEAQNGGIVAAADEYGFIMVVPQNPDCWDVNSTATLTHDGGGHTQGIAQMVKYAINTYHANSNRVYVTGTSCGAMMTEALLAVYPDIFKAGASFSGQAVGGAWTPVTQTAQQWGNIVRGCYPGYSGPRPRVQLWHGTADSIINYSNQTEAIMQWCNVLGLSASSTLSTTVTLYNHQWLRQIWLDSSGATALDAWSEYNGPHGTDANLNALNVIPFMDLNGVNLTYPWMSQDVGTVGVPGSATYSNGVFSVTGSGADIWNTADAFQFDYVPVTGNCTIIARVASVQNVDPWSKAGIMIRESLNANAANAFIAVTPGNGVAWQTRSSTGGATVNSTTASLVAPYWVKLVRSGNTFTGYRSPDGVTWTPQGTNTISMASTTYVGLALTSHNNSTLCTATFDNVTAPGWLISKALVPAGLSATFVSTSQINLAWNPLTNATSYNVKRSTTNGGPFAVIATGVTSTNYQDGGLSGIATNSYCYVVSAVASGSETPDSAEAVLQFPKLAGAIIGTPGSYGGSGNTITNVFDNNLNTFFDGPAANGCWVGLDFGVSVNNVITQINYCPRATFESRMVGGIFQGANQADFSDAVTLATVATQPATGVFTSAGITNITAFRYVRYLSPNNGWGNVAELQFYGYLFANPVAAPAGLSALAVSTSQINLTWNALTNAANYNLKRSTTNGGPYSIIASGVTTTNYSDTGLAGGTTYYYVVSAMVSTNETPNSAQASATTQVPLILLGRWLSGAANFTETSGYSPTGTFDGFVVAGGSYYFTNDAPPNATGVSVYLNNSGIGISNTCLTWDARFTNTFDNRITNSFTVTCWAKGLPGGWNPWVSKYGENGKGWQLRTDGTAPTYPCWTIRNNGVGTVTLGTAVNGNPEDMASRSIAVNDGKWHHYAGTFDAGLGTRCLYVDGELAAAETGNAVYNMTVTNRLMLGARDGGSSTSSSGGYGSYFTGNLYDVRIYGSAASQTQIRSIAGLTPPSLTNRVVSGNQMVLTWSWGTLLQATNLPGPWTPVQAASPYTNSPMAPQQFFRISNP